MKKLIKEEEDLPFEIGKTYLTKFATGERFTINKIIIGTEGKMKGKIIGFEGIYEKAPHLGQCPLGGDRLYPQTRLTGNDVLIHICPHCKKSFKD